MPVQELSGILTIDEEFLERKNTSVLCANATNISTRSVPKTIWLLYQIINLLKREITEFFVKSTEQSYCPCCCGGLKVIGSRNRKYFKDEGTKVELIIRRLRCSECNKVHHELPDILVPYKRYYSKSIEAVLTGNSKLTVAADESTIYRWKEWFVTFDKYFLGCLISIAIKLGRESVEVKSCLLNPVLKGIFHYVGGSFGWLRKVVRSIANSNLWVHTRSAFLS